ncbi:hypothetical protein Aduo_004205 [Ancylostoma duodenale]
MQTYKYGFILTAVQDLVTSLCTLALIPRVISRNSYLIFIATGYLSDFPYGQILLVIVFFMVSMSLLIITNNFIYRYIQVCKIRYSYIYTRSKSITVICAVNMIILLNCAIVMVVCAWPCVDFRQQLYKERITVDVSALEQKSFMGFSIEHSITHLTILLMVDGLLMMVMFTAIGSYSAFRIRSTLKRSSLSGKTTKMHKKMFHLLLLQCACPTLFVYIPLCVCYAIVFTSIPTEKTVTDMIGIAFLLYPLLNPIVTMLCVKDYRNFISSLVRRRSYNAHTVTQSYRTVFVLDTKTQ